MATYWKSQPKRFCDFCKCWINENKASVDFHEKGKKHQENVKLRIDEVKKKGSERRQQKEQLNDDLAAIEAAALKAYKKDLGYTDVEKPNQSKPNREHETKLVETATSDQSSFSAIENWSAYQTDEGYWYYYNNQTGETTWNPPQGFQSHDQSVENKVEDDKSNQLPVNDGKPEEKANPFGAWETVAVYESATANPENTVVEHTEDVPAVKFKEKQLPTRKGGTDLSSNDITFKKRKGSQERKRNIRQRTDDS